MNNLKSLASLLATATLLLGLSGAASAAILFEETFSKDATGNLTFPRIVIGEAGPATIVLINGTGGGFDGVKKGRVDLNSDVVYGGLDFKVTGTIFKTVALVDGSNALDIMLGGPTGGQMTIRVIQGADEPTLEFPPGSVFVSSSSITSEDVEGCGIITLPCKTITFGMSRGASTVVVAAGIYAESVALINGQDLLGGYNPEFTARNLATSRAIIRGNTAASAAVSAENIDVSTLLEGFIIFAPTTGASSANSVGIYVENSTTALQIQNNLIFGGVAGYGADGASGFNGQDGYPGTDGHELVRFLTTEPGFGPYVGGSGGMLVIGAQNVSGGLGGTSYRPVFDAQQGSGTNGLGFAGGGGGGAGGFNSLTGSFGCGASHLSSAGSRDGAAGSDGADGIGGTGGQGGTAGIGAANEGKHGSDGNAGAGGGGGGAGGGADALSSCDSGGPSVVYGHSGGGGGSGAGGGTGGAGGGGGGHSVGIFVIGPGMPIIGSNEIYLGIAGDGGHGGQGAFGGFGGKGGAGLHESGWEYGVAGDGGTGGDGGSGGGGGGGSGGLSVGIFANFDVTGTYDVDNEIHVDTGRAGAGGKGGFSSSNSGQDGEDGAIQSTLFQP